MTGVTGAADVVDAAILWTAPEAVSPAFGPRARADALLALRRAARAWPPLAPLLSAAVPGAGAFDAQGRLVDREIRTTVTYVRLPEGL